MNDVEEKSNSNDLETDENLCVQCNEGKIDYSENPNSNICVTCREKYKKYPFPKWMLPIVLLILIINAISYVWFPSTFVDFLELKRADKLFAEKYFAQASEKYYNLGLKYSASESIIEKQLDSYYNSGSYDDVANIINNYYIGREVSDTLYAKLDNYIKHIDKYFITSQDIYNLWNNTELTKEDTYKNLEMLLESPDKDQSLILVEMAQIKMSENNYEEALDLFNDAYFKQKKYTWILSYIASAQRRLHKFDEAEEISLSAIEKNRDDTEAYRQLAVLSILNKDYDKALKYAKVAYDINKYSFYTSDTLATVYYLRGETDNCNKVLKDMEESEIYIDEQLQQLLNGEITVESIYLN